MDFRPNMPLSLPPSSRVSRAALVLGMAAALAACVDGGEALSAANLVAEPDRVVPVGLYYGETHVAEVALVMAGTGAAVAIDDVRVEDESGPADIGVITSDDAQVGAQFRVTARGSAGVYATTVVLIAGGTEVPVDVVVPIRPPPSCDDNNPCTTDWREGAECLHTPIASGTPCDDDNACTTNDMCNEGTCTGAALQCEDDVGCTENTCDPQAGCVFVPNADHCDDGDACTEDICDADSGCRQQPEPEGSVCAGDGGCDMVGFCIQGDCIESEVPDGFWCDDGDSCTSGDVCAAGVCVPGPNPSAGHEPAFVESGSREVDVCGGLAPGIACGGGAAFLSPEAVLDVHDDSGISHVLWRTPYVNQFGALCDPNAHYALPIVSIDGDGEGIIESDEEPNAIPLDDFCAAAVFLTSYAWDTREFERHAIASVRGAVAAKFLDDSNVLLNTAPGGAGVPEPDDDADGDRAEPPPPPLPSALYSFVLVAAQPDAGAGLSVITGVNYSGDNPILERTSVAPNIATPISRAGAVDIDIAGDRVTVLALEAQTCPYSDPAQNALCFPQLARFDWNVGAENSTLVYEERVLVEFGCHVPGQLVIDPEVSVSSRTGDIAFAVARRDACSGMMQVSAGTLVLPDTLLDVPQRHYTLTTLNSMQVSGTTLYLSGSEISGGFDQVGEPDGVPDLGPTANGVISNLLSSAEHYVPMTQYAALGAPPEDDTESYIVLNQQSLTLTNLFDDGPGITLQLADAVGTDHARPMETRGQVTAFSAYLSGFGPPNMPVPANPELGIMVARWGCF